MIEPIYTRDDTLGFLYENNPLADKLAFLHRAVSQRQPMIHRVAIALYDKKTDLLKTFIHSSDASTPLSHYQAKLADSKSLSEIVAQRRPRVANNLAIFAEHDREHSKRIAASGYGASYTMPMFLNGEFSGFIFFNSRQSDVFNDHVLHDLDLFGHLLSLTVISELQKVETLVSAVSTARNITHHRDNETGAHLDRMSRYARLIAVHIADKLGLDDNFIEHVFMFAPLHDIGKVSIPDGILLKQGKLTADEYEVMKTHASKGRKMVDEMLHNFGLSQMLHSDILRNITELHHEALNGSGYPHGLRGDAIPIEARIIAVADIFDALTSRRPYKEAWPVTKALDTLRSMTGEILDHDCVEALYANIDAVLAIQQEFKEDPLG